MSTMVRSGFIVPLLLATSCAETPPAAKPETLDDAVVWLREVELEESVNVINVIPRVTLDRSGGFLVADRRESQVRRYAPSGSLTTVFGRRGSGPGEFEQLLAAVNLGDVIVAFESSGRYASFTPAGELVQTGRIPVANATDVRPVGDSTLLIAGQRTDVVTPQRLHIWHPGREQFTLSFFEPPARAVSGPISADIGPRGIAAIFGLSDSIYVFTLDGELLQKIRPPTTFFRPYADPESMPPDADWPFSFSTALNVFWNGTEDILFQYGDALREGGYSLRLMNISLTGDLRFELLDTPRLLTTAPLGRELVFVAPRSLLPNIFAVAALQ